MILKMRGVHTDADVGVIYVLYREDLNKCYVGQTVDIDKRMAGHRSDQRRTTWKELWSDGNAPEVLILENHVPVESLDVRESLAMELNTAWGWHLTNEMEPWRLGPTSPAHRVRLGKNGSKSMKLRRQCSECGMVSAPAGIGAHQRGSGHVGFVDLDPLDMNGNPIPKTGPTGWTNDQYVPVRSERKKQPSRARYSESERLKRRVGDGKVRMTELAKEKRKCSECELTSTPGALGRHQSVSGHTGFVQISTYLSDENTNPTVEGSNH